MALPQVGPATLGAFVNRKATGKITDPEDPVVKILFGYKADQIPIVAANDQITAALFDMGLAHEMVVNSQAVGVDMGNRGGEGVNAMEVDALGVDIINDGYSPGKTSHACCIQQQPGKTDIEEFTASLRAGTDLPPWKKVRSSMAH